MEYVSGAVNLLAGEAIVAHIVNDSAVSESTRVVIFRNTGAGAVVETDSGAMALTPTWTGGIAHTISSPGTFWVRIQASSEALIPKASFERDVAGVFSPIVSYKPGDFAVFSLARKRLW
jgi:hypothetical protein